MGVTGTVFIIFLILKLAGLVGWSWWIVFLPLVIEAVIDLGAIVVFVLGGVFAAKHAESISEKVRARL